MGICFDVFCVIDAQLQLCIALHHESRRVADFPRDRQLDRRARKCVTANALLLPAEQSICTRVIISASARGARSAPRAGGEVRPP